MQHRTQSIVQRLPLKLAGFCLVLVAFLSGCGENVARVKGTAAYKGAPVKGGTVIFSPIGAGLEPGSPATADVKSDGTFRMVTNTGSDGAIVGKHRVSYTPPAQELTEEQRKNPKYIAPLPPYMGLVAKQTEIEIKPGDNTIEIELIRRN